MENAQGHVIQMNPNEAMVEFRLATVNTGEAEYADAITERVIGITQQAAAIDTPIPIQVNGVSYCVADGSGTAIAIGSRLMVKAASDGVAVVAAGATAIPCAIALEATTAATGVIKVLLTPNQAVVGS